MKASGKIEPARTGWPLAAALALLLVSLLVFRPGVAMYDTLRQYSQVLSGQYDDWHPPAMARLWALLHPFWSGTGPMFLLQLAGYWLGLGLFARALGGLRAVAVLVVAASPVFLGWQVVVLKDAQLVAALACVIGLSAHYRLRGLPTRWFAALLIALCLLYAALLRANAAFCVVPLAVLLFFPASRKIQAAATLAIILLTLVTTQWINRHVLLARDSGVARSEAIYDLAAIAVRTGDATPGGAPTLDLAALTAGQCVKPLFWDPLTSRDDCEAALNGLDMVPAGQLYAMTARAALAHPLAYAGHRLAHLNATWRWWVPWNWPLAAPPAGNEPNQLGLESPPGALVLPWQRIAGRMTEMPPGWPIAWIALGLWALAQANNASPGPRRTLAFALAASALCQEASFAVLSISSDLRYHLWPMLAVALAWILLAGRLRRPVVPLLALAFVLVVGLLARASLPLSPAAYSDLLS